MPTADELWRLPVVRQTVDSIRAAEQQFADVLPEQELTSWGTKAVRFFPMSPANFKSGDSDELPETAVVVPQLSDLPILDLIFVDISNLQSPYEHEMRLGASQDEALDTRERTVRAYQRGWRWGWHYSLQEPRGEVGMTHRSMLWPISGRDFQLAEIRGWHWRGQAELEKVVAAMVENQVPVHVPILDRGFVLAEVGRELIQLDVDIIRGMP